MSGEMTHVVALAEEIGPRPATTNMEARAADYIQGVFEARGLEVERQEFDSARTYSWAFVVYHLLTIGAAVLSRWFTVPAFLIGLLSAVLMWLDLDTRWSLSSLLSKGPSQNVIARHVPRVRRNERTHRIIVVAHYDSARASLAFGPGMVRNFSKTFGLMKYVTYLVPVLVLASSLPWLDRFGRWPWYVTLAVSAYLVLPLVINVHREVFMKFVDGANDNASGVAAMLGVMERIVPELDVVSTASASRVRRSEEEARAAQVVEDDVMLSYAPISAPRRQPELWVAGEDDIDWSDPSAAGSGQTSITLPSPGTGEAADAPEDDAQAEERLGGAPASDSAEPGRHGLFGRSRQEAPERRGVRDWLGVGNDFDARREGKVIGSWDKFDDDDPDDDEIGWKGGALAGDAPDAPGFASSEAARIRDRVTHSTDRDLSEKEVWFVATGAEEVGTLGMRAFLKEHGHDLRDAFILNIDNVGSGAVTYVSAEGMARRYPADRRLLGAARRAVTENDLPIRSRVYKGLSTDATPALARGFRAMSVMGFDINGRLPNWHWPTDTVENVSDENLARTADFVCDVIKEL